MSQLMTLTGRLLLLAGVLGLQAGTAFAQNFLMNSAETINKGNFKLCAFPTVLFGEDDAEDEWGLASRIGYGFTPSFDIEAKLAKFDRLTMYGADAEYWLLKGRTDVSLSAGAHKSDFDGGGGSVAIDTAVIVSRSVGKSLEAYLGGSLSFESLDDVDDSSSSATTWPPASSTSWARTSTCWPSSASASTTTAPTISRSARRITFARWSGSPSVP